MLVPILSEFEDERLVLNLEQRPQKTTKIFDSFGDCRNLKRIMSSIFQMKNNPSNCTTFMQNILEQPSLFNAMIKKFIFLYNTKKYVKVLRHLYKYPTKPSLEDFYLSNKVTKNSSIMLESSQYLQKLTNNFEVKNYDYYKN